MLLELLLVLVELAELVRQDVGIWHEVEMLLPVTFLHSYDVEAKSIFPCNLVTLRKMVDLLILVQAFIKVAFARA